MTYERFGLYPYRVKFKGEFNLKKIYSFFKGFFLSRKYDLYETRYKEKTDELEINWTAEQKINEYYTFKIKIEFHIWEFKKIKETDNQTIAYGRIIISITPELVENEAKIFKEGGIIHKAYRKVTEREREEKWEDDLDTVAQQLRDKLKELLGSQAI